MAGIRDVGPSWLHESHNQRHPITVDGVTGTSSGTVEVTVTVPTTWDDFWDNVTDTTNGYDIVVTGSDGVTVLTYDFSGTYSNANRVCVIRISGLALAASTKMTCIWLYWNRASAPNQTGAPTFVAPITGYIYLGRPAPGLTVQARKVPVGNTTPDQKIFKDPGETINVWWDLTDVLVRRQTTYNAGAGFEGISYASHTSDPASLTSTDAQSRFAYVPETNRLYLKGQSSSGASGTDSTITLTVVTTESRTLVYKVGVDIQTVAV